MPEVHLLLGSNMGDREALLRAACHRLGELAGPLTAISGLHTTAPWGDFDPTAPPPEPFVNQAVELETDLAPEALLDVIHLIENELGRGRENFFSPDSPVESRPQQRLYSSRTIDIDIIFYGDQVINTERLTVPHPRMCERTFVLIPLCEICPQKVHPIEKKSVEQLLNLHKVEKVSII